MALYILSVMWYLRLLEKLILMTIQKSYIYCSSITSAEKVSILNSVLATFYDMTQDDIL